MDATTIGVDLSKTVFELAVANTAWRVIGRKRFTRLQFRTVLGDSPGGARRDGGVRHGPSLGSGRARPRPSRDLVAAPVRTPLRPAEQKPIAPMPRPCSRRSAAVRLPR